MESKILPEKLKKGDVVGIISPSTAVWSRRDLSKGMEILETIELKPRLGPKALEVSGNYIAGSVSDRLRDFHSMFLDDEVKAVFCTGGGYVSIQLLPGIDWNIIEAHPKIFMGFSDITTLLNSITEKTGLVTFHGPTVEGLYARGKRKDFTLKQFEKALFKGEKGRLTSNTEWKTLKPGRGEGPLVGGNLNVLLSLMGTPYEPKWEGKVLFWEETDETVEGIDNYLWRLRVAKVLKKIEAMVVGKIVNVASIEDETESWAHLEKPYSIESVILSAVQGYDFPVLYGVDFGHDVPSLVLPIGAKALVDCPHEGRIGALWLSETFLKQGS